MGSRSVSRRQPTPVLARFHSPAIPPSMRSGRSQGAPSAVEMCGTSVTGLLPLRSGVERLVRVVAGATPRRHQALARSGRREQVGGVGAGCAEDQVVASASADITGTCRGAASFMAVAQPRGRLRCAGRALRTAALSRSDRGGRGSLRVRRGQGRRPHRPWHRLPRRPGRPYGGPRSRIGRACRLRTIHAVPRPRCSPCVDPGAPATKPRPSRARAVPKPPEPGGAPIA